MAKDNLVFEDFENRVGSVFSIREEGFPAMDLALSEAVRLSTAHNAPADMRPPFSLTFLGAGEPMLPQRLYQLAHAQLGDVTIFLVPIAKDAQGARYQAIFN